MNDHGWTELVGNAGPVKVAVAIDPRRRCACATNCARKATAEDLLCDQCRTECR